MFKDKDIKICIVRQITLLEDVLILYKDDNAIDYTIKQNEDPTDISIRIKVNTKHKNFNADKVNENITKIGDDIANRFAKMGYATTYRTMKMVYDIAIDIDISEYIQDIYKQKYKSPYIKEFYAYKPHLSLTRDEHRRLIYLLSTEHYSDKIFIQTLSNHPTKYNKKRLESLIEIHNLFDKYGLSDAERNSFWTKYKQILIGRKHQTSIQPIKVKKDNPNTYGEPFPGCGTPRKPKKCRKTAWKRFYKIYPNLDPKNKKEI